MRRISSSSTWWHKKAFPTIWFGFLAVFTCVWIIPVARGEVPAGTIFIPLGMAAFGYLLMRVLVFPLVDEVWIDGDDLVVRNRDEEDRFPITNIVNVDNSWMTNPEQIRLTLRNPSRFGQEIVFSPPIRWWPFGRHPVSRELIARAHGLDVGDPMRA
jgi:hypothetical protein